MEGLEGLEVKVGWKPPPIYTILRNTDAASPNPRQVRRERLGFLHSPRSHPAHPNPVYTTAETALPDFSDLASLEQPMYAWHRNKKR